jgi:hypothetical protein
MNAFLLWRLWTVQVKYIQGRINNNFILYRMKERVNEQVFMGTASQ